MILPFGSSVHPHGRGDGATLYRARPCPAGSPPRAWGRPEEYHTSDFCGTVHPHGRGDGTINARQFFTHTRFTPTGVGTAHNFEVSYASALRFTPTGVGTAIVFASPIPALLRFTPTGVGTAKPVIHTPIAPARFTPTGVGTARYAARVNSKTAVHPHGRGDGVPTFPSEQHSIPVHPHGRGDGAQAAEIGGGFLRFTPTGVGTAV